MVKVLSASEKLYIWEGDQGHGIFCTLPLNFHSSDISYI